MKSFLKNSSGITMIELITAVAIIALLVVALILLVDPATLLARGRDEKRLSDMSVLDRAISEYMLDNKSYPDLVDTTRYSNVSPAGNSGALEDPTDGWIDTNLSAYLTRLPTDPINDATYRYIYRHTTFTYELNALLEAETTYMTGDGGDDDSFYELGNDLTIL